MLTGPVTTSEALEAAIKTHDQSGSPLYLVFFADWCPDCRDAAPIIKSTFGEQNQPTAIQVMVGERLEWRSRTNAFRSELWKVTNIPTLVKFENGKEIGRLVESDILDQQLLTAFLR